MPSAPQPIRPCFNCDALCTTGASGPCESLVAPTEDEVAAGDEVTINDGDDEETEPIKHARDPGRPTPAQVEDHRKSHIPLRLWCRWCILGRGRGLQHLRKAIGSMIPIVGIDYFFLTKGGVKRREELDFPAGQAGDAALEEARAKGDVVKCLLLRCFLTKTIFAHVVPQKGLDEANVVCDFVLGCLQWLGHTRIILKSDNEPAVEAVVKRVVELAKIEIKDLDQVSKEDPASYDSQSNGGTEVGIRIVRGLLRTLKLCLEQRIGKYIPVDHPVMGWLLGHVCMLQNILVRGPDGLTSWQRVRGRAFGQQLVGFGECVLYRYPGKGPHHQPDGNV